MLRSVPGALDPGAPPRFRSPDQVIAWVRGVDWLLGADRAVVLHLDAEGGLTCVASAHARLQHLGPLAKEALAAEALQCGTAAVLAVDLRQKVPPSGPSTVDRRRHYALRTDLAVHGVALLDTVIVAPAGGVSVTGSLNYPLGLGLSWLRVHVPGERSPLAAGGWAHEDADHFPPASASVREGGGRPTLWLTQLPTE
jgi:hypothetical protein